MTDPKLQTQLSTLQPHSRLTVVLQWPANLDRAAFARISSPKERLTLLDQHYRGVKAPVLKGLAGFADVDVQDLPSSGSAIVTTTAGRLQGLIDGGILGQHSEVDVVPNEEFHTLAGS